MKKLLLFAALAAVALGASAGYNLEQVWELNTSAILTTADARQGYGMDGKFYINDKGSQTVYVLDQTGIVGTLPGGKNCGLTFDEAGNLVIGNAEFPGVWAADATIKVVDRATGVAREYVVPEECGLGGRSDMLGFAKGNLLEDGVLYFTGANTDGICVLTITDGEVNADECYMATCDGLINTSSTVIYYYKDINNQEALLYDYRSGFPSKLVADGDDFTRTGFELPNFNGVKKGHANGVFPFVWDGKEFYIYTLMPDYREGFAIAEANAEAPIAGVDALLTANPNSFQGNWLNAEVDENGVTIYQYVPGYRIAVYRLTKTPDYYVGCNLLDNWNYSNYMMEMDEETGLYTLAVDSVQIAGGTTIEYKVTTGVDWWPTDYNAEYYVPETGVYNLVFTYNTEGNIVGIQVTKLEVPEPEMVYTVAGPAHVFGTEWDPENTANDMVLDPETNLYTWSKQNVQLDDFFGFKVVGNHAWGGYEWPIGYENNYNVYLTDGAGVYDIVITFNPEAEADYKITVTLTKKAGLRGDVNDDQVVNISDVTDLINYLLTDDAEGINLVNANCNLDEGINISDVTDLINYLLTDAWAD